MSNKKTDPRYPEPDIAHWTERVLEKMEEAGRLPKPKRVEVADQGDKPFESVCCEDVEHEESTELGPYLVLRRVWESLGLDAVLKDRDFSDEQLAAAQVSVFNRLVEPVSENELPNWVATTALGELLGVHPERWAEDRFYRVSDRLLAARETLEPHLREQERDLFNLDRAILLYDLTNSHFEGLAEATPWRNAASPPRKSAATAR